MALQPEDLKPGRIIECMMHRWRIVGVHLGGEMQESLIELENVTHTSGWTGEWEWHPRMFVPEVLLRAAAYLPFPGTVAA